MAGIDPELYMHDTDREAAQHFQKLPGVQKIMKTFVDNGAEVRARLTLMSNALRLGEEQMPQYYNLLPPICEKLGIKVPEMYLLHGIGDAYTIGNETPMIVLYDGVYGMLPPGRKPVLMTPEELTVTLAHECGHIACGHVLFMSIAHFLKDNAFSGIIPKQLTNLLTGGMQVALSVWIRCAEFSADRAAAIVTGSAEPIQNLLISTSGLGDFITSKEAFMRQGEECMEFIRSSKWLQMVDVGMNREDVHPTNSARYVEITNWCGTDDYKKLSAGVALPENDRDSGE